MKNLTTTDFDSFLKDNKDKTVVIDFWAEWCGPCKMLSPVLEELEGEMGAQVVFTKVNVDEEGELAMRYSVQSIPTVLVFKNEAIVATTMGFRPKADFKKFIEDAMNK